ncbi:Na+/H+ antiporter NhaC family protein [uncultured Helicobacter sp.]|uniref:Na+/H+ antiporter NhaC family protein n=1 Tax=uncultured Helicobacter sp. TaxID=175537 RepID=UPI00374E801D
MYAHSALSLLVPLVTIALVFLTRRVVLSFLLGIVLASIMLHYQNPLEVFVYAYKHIASVFYTYQDDGLIINAQSLYVFGFLFILGILTQLMSYSGGISAFVLWARKRVKTQKGSEFFAFIAGIVVFVDDYFNALTVGQMSKSLNDANHSTRERLAYIIDSTSAPICILMPISSWGAYIIMQLNTTFQGDSFVLLFSSIWGNYYAWFALLAVFLTIIWQINLPAMRKNQNVDVVEHTSITAHTESSIWLLIIPIFALLGFVAGLIFYTGYQASGEANLISMLGNTDTGFSLFFGGLGALVLSLFLSLPHIAPPNYIPILKTGIASMLPACLILILAWAIGPIIKDDLSTGVYLANLSKEFLESSALNPHITIVVVSFAISGFIAFCTGTSWATFAIMIPIASSLAQANGVDVVLVLSAVLSGAVYGDHASPISDTTILSATGAGCSVQSHFITQLPYVSVVALIAIVSFGVAGWLDSRIWGYVIGLALMFGIFYVFRKYYGDIALKATSQTHTNDQR